MKMKIKRMWEVWIFDKIPATEAEIVPQMYFIFQVQCPIVTMSGPFEGKAFKVDSMIFDENPSNRRPGAADREVCFLNSAVTRS